MTSLQAFLKTTPKYVQLLAQSGIQTVKEFLETFPRTYEDRGNITALDGLYEFTQPVTAKIQVTDKKLTPRPGGKKMGEILFVDSSGAEGILYFSGKNYQFVQIKKGEWYLVTGKPKKIGRRYTFRHPEIALANATDDAPVDYYNIGRITPIYSEMLGIKPSRFAKKIREHLNEIPQYFHEYLPGDFLKKFNLLDVATTLRHVHFPDSHELKDRALYRVFFDRLLRIQLFSLMNRAKYQSSRTQETQSGQQHREILKQFVESLPFTLTHAQKKVIKEIIDDFALPRPMLRLLQGDVGSGKTVVAALAAIYLVRTQGKQAVFLAPLEILAQQHFLSLSKLLLPLGIRVELLSGSLTASTKKQVKQRLRDGNIDIIVGTHALIQEDVGFKDLGLVVIDEQHKFGVKQRAFFKHLGAPHILQMSATPIPRSMALAFFGEFDVSIIDQMPAGRKPIVTKIVSDAEFIKLKPWLLAKMNQNQKLFVVTPLIQESEVLDTLQDAHTVFEEMKSLFGDVSDQVRIGLLHGKMSAKDKDDIMNAFKSGKINVLVATTVIEVGVDVPEATLMIIKNAERFGLSQLHQLRGRIGRNDLQSYCFLQTPKKSGLSGKRLKAMEETNDGFKLAQIDLQYRGSGEILGTRQSGQTDIPLEMLGDLHFIEKVREGAHRLLERYPNLEGLENLKDFLRQKMGGLLA